MFVCLWGTGHNLLPILWSLFLEWPGCQHVLTLQVHEQMMIETLLRPLRISATFLYGPSLFANNLLPYPFVNSSRAFRIRWWSHVLTICHFLFFSLLQPAMKICHSLLMFSTFMPLITHLTRFELFWFKNCVILSFILLYGGNVRWVILKWVCLSLSCNT